MALNIGFKTENGDEIDGTETVFPIMRVDSNGEWNLLATAFFILTPGIFVTAKHAVLDNGSPQKVIKGMTAIHFINSNEVRERSVRHVWLHPTADIAFGILREIKNDTGEIIHNKVLRITKKIPKAGTKIETFAFPESIVGEVIDKDLVTPPGITVITEPGIDSIISQGYFQPIKLRPAFYLGEVISYEPRGLRLVKGPCFELILKILDSSSGGPIFDENGHVFAINSVGGEGELNSIGTSIKSVLDMRADSVLHEGEMKKIFGSKIC